MNLSIRMECTAMIFIAVIALFHLSGQTMRGIRHKLFSWCLFLAEGNTALDILTILMIEKGSEIPQNINLAVNMIYFLGMNTLLSVIAVYAFYVLFDHIQDRHCFNIAVRMICIFFAVMQLLVLINPWTKWLFFFENGVYKRGSLNRFSYLMLLVELGMFCMCYLRNRRSVSRAVRRMMQFLPPTVLVLSVIQIFIPDILLNGTLVAVGMLIFYLSFQSSRLYQDSLTELPNRIAFLEELRRMCTKGEKVHLLMVHLEHFALVNQKFGMEKGDDVLFMVARYLDQVSDEYQVFRFRNTKFILLGRYNGEAAKKKLAEEIQKRFEQPWKISGTEYTLHTGLGCAVADSGDEEQKLLDQLDFAVAYSQEHRLRKPVCLDQELQERFERRAYVMEQLRRALKQDRLQIYFQPVYDCRTNRFTSAETLVRLWDENGNYISPGEFIPLAERHGLIDEISWAVLRKVCTFLKENPSLPLNAVSVNFSVQEIENAAWSRRLLEFLRANQSDRTKICIEITERTMTENPQVMEQLMQELKKENVTFYLDDFGIGYSNLSSLLQLPFEVVKLDSSLIEGIGTEKKIYEMVRHLIEMLHNAGFEIVAEGVETEEQVRIAREISVDRIQGYYYAKPMSKENLLRFLQESEAQV